MPRSRRLRLRRYKQPKDGEQDGVRYALAAVKNVGAAAMDIVGRRAEHKRTV